MPKRLNKRQRLKFRELRAQLGLLDLTPEDELFLARLARVAVAWNRAVICLFPRFLGRK